MVNCYQINEDLKLGSIDPDNAVRMAHSPAGRIWIDVQGGEGSELESLLDKLDVRQMARHLCIEAREHAGFYPLNTFILLVIPVQGFQKVNSVDYITVLCNKNLLMTLRNQRPSYIQQIVRLQETADWLQNRSIAALASAIMMVLSQELLQQLSEFRAQVSVLERQLELTPEQVRIDQLSDKRSKLLIMEAVINGQLPALQALLNSRKSFFETETVADYLSCALVNVQSVERSLHWLEGRIEVVRSHIEMRSQDKVNHRLARLTVLSTIFMPITFLAGIWGMNFEFMPELSNPYGYWMALGFMTLIGAGMFIYFRWKDWFS